MRLLFFILLFPVVCFGQGKYDLYLKMNKTAPNDMSTYARTMTADRLQTSSGKVDYSVYSRNYAFVRLYSASYVWDSSGGGTSIGFWLYATTQNDTVQTILQRSTAAHAGLVVTIPLNTQNINISGWLSGSNTLTVIATFTNAITLNVWQHFVVTCVSSSGSGIINLYKNGYLFGSNTSLTFWIGKNTSSRYLMSTSTGINFLTNGYLDEFFILNRVMNPQEVKTLYDNKRGCY